MSDEFAHRPERQPKEFDPRHADGAHGTHPNLITPCSPKYPRHINRDVGTRFARHWAETVFSGGNTPTSRMIVAKS